MNLDRLIQELWLFNSFFWHLFGFIDRTASEMTGNKMRERGATSSKGPQAGTWIQSRCSEDKASLQGTPALVTELMGAPIMHFWPVAMRRYLQSGPNFMPPTEPSRKVWRYMNLCILTGPKITQETTSVAANRRKIDSNSNRRRNKVNKYG